MELLTLTLICIACFWVYKYVQNQLNYFKNLGVPAVPNTPFIGSMFKTVLKKQHVCESIKDMYNYHPEAKYIGAFNFLTPIIVIRDPELIKSITIKNFEYFPDHQGFVDEHVDPLFGSNLFAMTGEKWRETRNLLTPSFTSSKMKTMFDLIAKCAENFVKHMAKEAKNPNNMIATKEAFSRYTVDVIATCAFGINVDSFEEPKNQFYVLGREAANFEGLLSVKMMLNRAFPKIMKFLRIKLIADHIAKFFTDVITNTVRTRDEQGITRPDMLQLMMDYKDKSTGERKLSIMDMTTHAFGFFFGGFDTTSSQMCIIAHELTIKPHIQKKLQAEIDSVMEECNGKPTYEAINGMPYLDAVFNESMRRHSQSTVIDRVCVKPFELPPALPGYKPITVQPGMNIWIPVVAIHHSEEYYENPLEFDPERYYDKKVTINQVENMGFGIGPRSCIGNRFAILETKILFFYLLSKFNLKPNAKTCDPFVYDPKNFIVKPIGGYWLTVEARS